MTQNTAATSVNFQPASGRAYAALVLGVLGLVGFIVLAPVAWYLGWAERRDIRAGLSPAGGDDIACVGMILGAIGTLFMGLAILAIVAIAALVLAVIAIVT